MCKGQMLNVKSKILMIEGTWHHVILSLTTIFLLLATISYAQWLETTITVGSNPYALVYNSTNNKIYCANWGSYNVTVIDGATNSVITTIAIGGTPRTLVYNPTDNKVYSANYYNDNVTVIDGASNSVITTIPVGTYPCAFVYNLIDNKVYCANYYSNNVTVIDGASNSVITTIPVGTFPIALVYNQTDNKVYSANYYSNNVTVIDGTTNSVITTISAGSYPNAFEYNQTNNKVYCANGGSDNVTVIDGTTNSVITTISVIRWPIALVHNSVDNKIYCANNWRDTVTVIAGTTDSIITNILVGEEPYSLVYNPTNNKIFCANEYSDDVTVIDGVTDSIITIIGVGDGPIAFTYNPHYNRVYVANYYGNSVSVIRDSIPAAPAFSVTSDSIDFGEIYVDSSKTDSVVVTNTGSATLDITSVVSDNPEFTVIPTTGSLAPAESMKFYITFAPIYPSTEIGNIIFTHNATTSPDTVFVTGTGIVGIEETMGDGVPPVYALSQNYPNPFKTEAAIHYQLPQPHAVAIAIYNVSGQRIKTLVNEHKDTGFYTVYWDGRSHDGQRVSNGVYFCRMVAGQYISIKKILLIR